MTISTFWQGSGVVQEEYLLIHSYPHTWYNISERKRLDFLPQPAAVSKNALQCLSSAAIESSNDNQ